MSKVSHVEIRCFRFACPQCGMTDQEFGHLATADEVHCLVCLVDDEQHVVLRRWLVEDNESAQDSDSGQHVSIAAESAQSVL